MMSKPALREFQTYLAERLDAVAGEAEGQSWLGLRVGDGHWLLDLADGGEIIQSPEITPVPMTRPWFLGLTNVRGHLFAVSDFAAFAGGEPTPLDAQVRLVLLGQRYGVNVALLVGRVLGLRRQGDFSEPQHDPELPAWGSAQQVDKHGTVWHRLSVRDLLADPAFMDVARPLTGEAP